MNITSYTELSCEELDYWLSRSEVLLGQPVEIVKPAPITFNRENWTGLTGTVLPTGSNKFIINDIDIGGEWEIIDRGDMLFVGDGEGREYIGYRSENKVCFYFSGSQWEHKDPRVAFAKMIYNI